jgi:lipopolysaccharide transport system ATP-binding protein
MGEVAREGRTVLFVSHNMTAVNQLCTRAVLLSGGRLALEGRTQEVVAEYFRAGSDGGGERVWTDEKSAPGNRRMRLRAVRLVSDGRVNNEPDIDKELSVEVEFWNYVPGGRNQAVNIYLQDSAGNVVLSTANTPAANAVDDDWFRGRHAPGLYRSVCTIPANFLNEGTYYVTVYLVTLGPMALEAEAPQVLSFNVFDTGVMREAGASGRWEGVVRVRLPWRTEALAANDTALSDAALR